MLDTVRRSIQRATALTSNDLKKGVSGLATIGATAPFVGLLGTVVGVINAFVGIASTGSGGIGAVSAGIAEALVETALGLFVAIPAVWFYNYLSGRLEYFNVEMDNSSSEMVDYFIRKTPPEQLTTARGDRGILRPPPACDAFKENRMAMDMGGAKGGVKSDINVTPLVDVMLVLLIIMMIVAPLLQKGVEREAARADLQRRQARDAGPDRRRNRLAGAASSSTASPFRGGVRRRVEDIIEDKTERIVLIKADEDAQYSA